MLWWRGMWVLEKVDALSRSDLWDLWSVAIVDLSGQIIWLLVCPGLCVQGRALFQTHAC